MADVNITTKLQGAQAVLSGFKSITGAAKSLSGVLGALAGVAGLSAFALMARNAINTADALGKMSQRVGVSVEDLSALEFQAAIAGSSIEEVGASLRFFNRAIDEASQGTKEYTESFDRLGVSFTDTHGALRPTIDLMEDVAEKFSKMADGAQKTALAQQLFGRAGSNLIPLLNEGRAGFQAYREEAERFGLVIGGKTAKDAENFNDAMTRLQYVVRGAIMQAIAPFLEPLAKLATKFTELVTKSGALRGAIQVLMGSLKGIALSATVTYGALTIIGKAMGALVAMISAKSPAEAKLIWNEWKKDASEAIGVVTDTFEILFSKSTEKLEAAFKKMDKDTRAAAESTVSKLDALKGELAKMQEEYIRLTEGEVAARKFALAQGTLGEATGKAAQKIRDQIVALDLQIIKLKAAKTEADDLADSQKKQMEEVDKQIVKWYEEKRMWDERAQAITETVSPLAVYNRELGELNEIDRHTVGGLEAYDEIFARITKKHHDAIKDLQHLSEAERDRILKLREQRKAQRDLADELTRAANPMIAYTEAVRTYIFLLNKGWITQETFNESVKASAETFNTALDKQQGKMEKWQEVMIENMKGFGTEFTKQLDSILATGENSWRGFRDAIFSLFRRSVLDAFITQPLVEAVNKVIGAMKGGSSKDNLITTLGTAAGGYFGGGGGSELYKSTTGQTRVFGHAAGGTIPRGFVGLVGEEGPELIVPQSTSSIIPNHALGGGVVVNQYFQTGVTRAELATILPRVKAETINSVIDAKRRGGKMSRTF